MSLNRSPTGMVRKRGCPFSRSVYAGLAITSNGPAVVEFVAGSATGDAGGAGVARSLRLGVAEGDRDGKSRRIRRIALARWICGDGRRRRGELPGPSEGVEM